jgi:hypothetical protein
MKYKPDKKTYTFLFRSLSKWQTKLVFGLIAFTIIIGTILFTQSLVDELINREKNSVQLYSKTTGSFLDPDNENNNSTNTETYLFFIEQIIPTITFPVVVTYDNGLPIEPFEIWTLNIDFNKGMSIQQQRELVNRYIKQMESTYPPILIKDKSGKVINKVYYTHSNLVDKLTYFPIIAILIITTFIFIAYFSFSISRDNEQSKVWVGMSKEAAHQLGTPLSSLLAWLEIIKISTDNPNEIVETVSEMEKDLLRLNTIATRFSKIGSTPEKEKANLAFIIDNVCTYFDKRMPHIGKKVEIIKSLDDQIFAEVNVDLFAWVFENLIKNAAEAIENQEGKIYIYMRHNPRKIFIFVKDSGKGMSQKLKRQIFYPGFSTKRRGWGLGLSLCKRIIEEYHDGKIFVKESTPGKGSTFAIELPIKSTS